MSTVLAEILAAKRSRLAAGEFSPAGSPARAPDGARFHRALAGPGPNVLAEIKHRSPSAGLILPDAAGRIESVACAYRRGGAAALSIVVEQDFFGGDPSWLSRAKAASGLPVLMKDFVVEERQLDFAISIGADAVLLIAAALDDESLGRLHSAALARGLAVLVETHDEPEVRRASALGAAIVGVNARDLTTFRVDLGAMARLGAQLPAGAVRVAESGIGSRADLETLTRSGYGAFLVGESLLRSADPARALRALRGDGTTEVKICGLMREEDLASCATAGVDWIGLNVSPYSRRRLTHRDAARLRDLSSFARGVALVVAGNEPDDVRAAVEAVRPDVLQISDPLDAFVERPAGLRAWRAIRPGEDDLSTLASVDADAFLFDAPGGAGGTGRTFDWTVLAGIADPRPRILAGGLTPGNVAEALRAAAPAAVDVASGVERAPGSKAPELITAFVAAVRSVPIDPRGGRL